MKLTNKYSLPQSVYNLLAKERYNGNPSTDYSVTTLLQPPRITQLKRRHWDELEEDAMDNVWSLFGHIAHSLLEEHGAEGSLTEERLTLKINDRNISGQVDSYHDGVITDYKVTSAWTLVYGSRIKEWTEQLNMYAYIFQQSGHEVKELRICAILRDWDKNKAKQDSSYPQTPIQIIPIELWDSAQQFIEGRVYTHVLAEKEVDFRLPECTEEEMWCQPTKYAIMKKSYKRAVRVLDSIELCWDYFEQLGIVYDDYTGGEYTIVTRQGKRTRCEEYCSVNKFCSQYQAYLREISE